MPGTAARCRRFTLLDAMILIAATGAGCALARYVIPGKEYGYHQTSLVYLATASVFMMETLGFLVIRLRKPRPRWRRLMVQPGTVGCLTTLVFLLFQLLFNAHYWISLQRMLVMEFCTGLVMLLPAPLGSTVATAWVLLALSRRCRRERGWIEIFGILVSGVWIVVALTTPVLAFGALAWEYFTKP